MVYLCMKQHRVENIIKQLNVLFSPHIPISDEHFSRRTKDMECPEWDLSVLVEIYDIDKYCNDKDCDSN